MDDEAREQACSTFLSQTNNVYISTLYEDGITKTALFDDEGDPLAIGPASALATVAFSNGLVLNTRH